MNGSTKHTAHSTSAHTAQHTAHISQHTAQQQVPDASGYTVATPTTTTTHRQTNNITQHRTTQHSIVA
ncbi:MAG TPA: hypothetical protein V6C97_29785 [Oculatellaceae cyanobacterium]